MEKIFEIPQSFRDAILAYLLTRPMQEVENGVKLLRELKEIQSETIKP